VARAREQGSANIIRLGWVSLLNDISSDALIRVLPLYISGVLGAPMAAVGAIEGIAEASATLLKPAFGRVSDRTGTRKPFVVWGYAFSAVTRPVLAFAGSWALAGFLRFTDRVGKAVRTAPRDALIADSSARSGGGRARYGRSFGINRAMDTLGALLSVGVLAFYLKLHGEVQITLDSWRFLCLGLAIPGALSVFVVIGGVADSPVLPKEPKKQSAAANPARSAALPPGLKRYFIAAGLFALANSSDAFVLLRLRELGFSLPGVLGFVALHSVVAAASSLPASALSDRMGRKPLLAAGWTVYLLTYAALGSKLLEHNLSLAPLVIAFYGLFYGFTEGVEKAFVADLAPSSARGQAFGVFGLVVGGLALPASTGFGAAWEHFGSSTPFFASAALAGAALISLFLFVREPG
jgi:MFS family permease